MNNKEEKIKSFDPNGFSTNENLFGLPFTKEESEVVIVPVPWEVTVSYAAGTANAPEAVLEASAQVDLFDPYIKDAWKIGVFMEPVSLEIKEKIVEGRIQKRLKEMTLLDQIYIRDSSITIDELIKQNIAKLGENIQVRRFERFVLGEGLQKKQENFSEEVEKMIKK